MPAAATCCTRPSLGDDYGEGDDIAVDADGNAYVTGCGNDAAFVAKLNASGSDLVYATFLDGNGPDWGNGIAVDADGNAYVTGTTGSSDFPTTDGAFKMSHDNYWDDGFVAKLNCQRRRRGVRDVPRRQRQ